MVGLADLVASVVEEITGAVPRVLGRTQAQFELAQRLVSSLPCPGRSRHGETDAAGAAAEDRVDDGDRPGART
ncbi:MAG: hypothetical protein JST64_10635, partial [Actinobacteria bacterium]|nr:hypothetical protein [Actinomycetota bacterium]